MCDRDRSTDFWTIGAMREYGGGFISRLAEAYHFADDTNKSRIRSTWHEEWEKYCKMGKERRKELEQ